MEVSYSTWQEAVALLFEQNNIAVEGIFVLKAQQQVDEQVIAAIFHSHPDRTVAAELWRKMASTTLPSNHLESLQKGMPEWTRQAFAERIQHWETIFRASLASSAPE